MLLLILGVALWWAAHLFKRIAPAQRAALGNRGTGMVAIALFASVALMIIGYRMSDFVFVWDPPPFLRHVNNLLVVLAFYCYAADGMKTWLRRKVRHPQLLGFSLWAFAHLLVNGDLASIILFGGLLTWAGVQTLLINAATPRPAPVPVAPVGKEIGAVVGAILVTVIIGLIHGWIGPNPFG